MQIEIILKEKSPNKHTIKEIILKYTLKHDKKNNLNQAFLKKNKYPNYIAQLSFIISLYYSM